MASSRANKRSAGHGSRAFTLIECLVALAILAVLASTIVFQTGSFGQQLFRLEAKSVALWVAENTLDEMRMAERLDTSKDEKSDQVEMGGQSWIVTRSVSDTARAGFHRIDVSVAKEGEEGSVVTLTGFVADR